MRENAGGCSNHPSFLNNPQFGLQVIAPDTKVFVNLSQPDLRLQTQMNPAKHRKHFEPVGLVVLKHNDVKYKKMSYLPEDKIATSLFCPVRDLSFEFVAQPGNYVIVPCTFVPGVLNKFDLAVYTSKKTDMAEIKQTIPKKTLKSRWQGPTAGGCVNHHDTWMNNPQFAVLSSKKAKIFLSVEQELNAKEEPECIGIYVFKPPNVDAHRLKQGAGLVCSPSTFTNVPSTSAEFVADAKYPYIVMPTTFDPINRGFSISVWSLEADVAITPV